MLAKITQRTEKWREGTFKSTSKNNKKHLKMARLSMLDVGLRRLSMLGTGHRVATLKGNIERPNFERPNIERPNVARPNIERGPALRGRCTLLQASAVS